MDMRYHKNQLFRVYGLLKNITLSFFFLGILSCNALFAAQLKIALSPNPDPRVTGHKLYFAKDSEYIHIYVVNLKDTTVYVTPNLQKGTLYYFGATAYDQYGNESGFSNIISYQIPHQPLGPEQRQYGDPSDIFYEENFQNYLPGDNAMYWFDTLANNSVVEDNSLFEIYTINNNNVLGTDSTLINIHSHYIGPGNFDLTSFEYSGRIMRTSDAGAAGVTFLSTYPIRANSYHLRAMGRQPFHLTTYPHRTAAIYGNTTTGVIPIANEWYRFRIKVRDTGRHTEIQAKVWRESGSEPDQWQIIANDRSPYRLVSGTFGVWSGYEGAKFWDDLLIRYRP